jgi:transposase
MAKYKPYNYDQMIMVAVSLDEQLMPGTLEFAIHELIEGRVNNSIFDDNYKNDETGCPAYNPKILLKVVLLGYSRGLISSRKIERACRENIVFMALTCGMVPDHSTISAFVSSMEEEIIFLFRDILLVCEEQNLLGGTNFSLDGVKLPSNAAKEWSGTFENLRKKKEKLEAKVKELLTEHEIRDKEETEAKIEDDRSDRKKRQEQIKRLKNHAERIGSFLEENEPKQGKRNKEIQSNITDNESAKMVTSHGTIQGYNGQALVDDKYQIIIQAEAFGNGQDYDHITPIIDGAKDNIRSIGLPDNYFEGKILSADSNYHSEGNLKKCEAEKLKAYIPDVNFRQRDPRFSTQKRHKPEREEKITLDDFSHDKEDDCYVCPNNKVLKLRARDHKIRNNIFRRYEAKESDCSACSIRGKCLQTERTCKKTLSVLVEKAGSMLSRQMIARIDTKEGRDIYSRRLAIVEPVFGNIRSQKGLDRFTLRGKGKINIQWTLYCMVHNIEKIANYGKAA